MSLLTFTFIIGLVNCSDYYYATYDFRDDMIGGNPTGWVLDEGGGTINIIPSKSGHNKVVEGNDNDAFGSLVLSQIFIAGSRPSGTIEFFIEANDVTQKIGIQINEFTTNCVAVYIISDKIKYYYTGNYHSAMGGGVSDNIMYHFKIIFDVYDDQYDFYLNGVLLDADIPFRNVATTGLTKILIHTSTPGVSIFYLDAVGYSWDFNYDIGDNKFPELNMTDILTPIFGLFFLIFLMIIMIFVYMKVRIWLVILVLFLFSLIIGVYSLSLEYIPFNPYFSIFFVLFQSIFFLIKSLEVYK